MVSVRCSHVSPRYSPRCADLPIVTILRDSMDGNSKESTAYFLANDQKSILNRACSPGVTKRRSLPKAARGTTACLAFTGPSGDT